MTRQENDTAFGEVIEVILENGLEGLAEAMSIVINQAMKVERSRALRASPYERSTARIGYANGFKPKSLNSRVGKLFLSVPQVRGDGVEFYPTALDKGIRSERALKVALAEMYVQGVSTRKVTKVLEELCGLEISSSEVSRCAALLDDELEKWRKRPLGEVRFLQLDATYVKVRVDGEVRNCAVLIAVGIKPDGYRSILGIKKRGDGSCILDIICPTNETSSAPGDIGIPCYSTQDLQRDPASQSHGRSFPRVP